MIRLILIAVLLLPCVAQAQTMPNVAFRPRADAGAAQYSDFGTILLSVDAADSFNDGATPADGAQVDSVQTTGVNAETLTQDTDTEKPNYVASDANFNGEPSLSFDDAADDDDFLVQTTTAPAGSQPFTTFVVGMTDVTNVNQTFWYSTVEDLGIKVFGGETWRITAGTNLNGGTADTNPHILTALFNSTASEIWVDGTSVSTGDAGTNVFTQGFKIGTNNSGHELDGRIARILLYDGSLSTADREGVECLLSSEYGISVPHTC